VDKAAKLDQRSPTTREAGLSLPLGTVRLKIREFAAGDLDQLSTFVCDARVTRFMLQAPRDQGEAAAYLEQVMGYQRERPRSAWELAVTQNADGALIGACTLTLMAAGEADLGYMLARPAWKRGLATELACALLSAGFRELRLRRISSTVDVRNLASIRVLEKAGLRWEATYRRLRKVRDEWRDCHVFALSSVEWEALDAAPG